MEELRKKIETALTDECRLLFGIRSNEKEVQALTNRVMRVLEEEVEPECSVIHRDGRMLFRGERKTVRDWLLTEYREVSKMVESDPFLESPQWDVAIYMGFPYDRKVSANDFLIMWS